MTTRETGRAQLLEAAVLHFAEHGVANQSLRAVAAAIGTSHRMLIYHFGSREGLLAEVVMEVERQQREVFTELFASQTADSPHDLVMRYWELSVVRTRQLGPLLLELSGHAMQGQPWAQALKASLVEPWLEPLTKILEAAGHDEERARVLARLGLAATRGLLFFDLLSTGDERAVEQSLEAFLDLVGLGRP